MPFGRTGTDISVNRRDFLRVAAGASLAASGADAAVQNGRIPHRTLGKTGDSVPILGFGTAPTGFRRDLKHAADLYHEAISLGVNYFDTAENSSGYGISQKQLGYAFRDRRKEVFLVTKCLHSTADAFLRLLEANLKEMRTDHVDLLYLHNLGESRMPLPVILGRGGAFAGLLKAKREGLARFIGASGHHRAGKFVTLLKARDIDVMMNAVNLADRYTYDFERTVFPLARKKNVGLVAMKVFGGAVNNRMSNSKMPREHQDMAFRYALSEPGVACAVIGMATVEELRQNVERARRFTPLTAEERASAREIGRSLALNWGAHLGAVA